MDGKLTAQELHHLAMNIVGDDLEAQGYEFLAVNSKLKKDPQFVAIKNGHLFFVIVAAISYPDDPAVFDTIFLETIKQHAIKFKAKTYYAAVGLANATNYEFPVTKNDDYVVNYPGIKEI